MKACSLTATDEDGVAAPLKFMLSVAADRLPSFESLFPDRHR